MTTIFWAGDSTVKQNSMLTYPQTGIGQVFHRYVKRCEVQIENHAENGRSTKSFIDEGRLAPIYDRIQQGDFLFIQFGHNDEKKNDPSRYTEPDGTFSENLEKFVNVARNKGAYPVFITPVTRRLIHNPEHSHAAYSDAMRRTAERLEVPLIDLYAMSMALVEQAGDEASKAFYMHVQPGAYPHYPDGVTDNTHLRPEGALAFAGLIAQGLHELGGVYAALLSDEYEQWLKERQA